MTRQAAPHRPVAEAPALTNARTVVLSEADAATVETIMAALPDPATLEHGALVVLPAAVRSPRTLTRSVLAVFGRAKTAARSSRCTALVARGYVDVGAAAGADDDLAWGYAPARTTP